jgi:hypothetical protein
MKLRASIWLQVCLVFLVGANAILASSPADVPANVRTPNGPDQKLTKSSVVQTDLAILERARAANEDAYQALQSFVCNEQIERYKGPIDGDFANAIDTVTTKLSFERGTEQYTEIRQNKRPRTSLSSLPGAWSEGEFGTLLLQTQQLLQTQHVSFDSFADVAGVPAALYRFDVPMEESPWDLEVAGRHYRLPFRTNVWLSVNTGEMLKIERTSTSIAADTRISEIQWTITLDHVDLNGKQWLLPRTGTYAVLYQESRRREWNVLNFSGYQRYGAQTSLSFY